MKRAALFEQRESDLAVERLTALWALNEAGLGGLMHALKSPFTGIIVGGTAIMLITLIAYFAKQRTAAILKAMAIVLIIKATVSPHSPLPAYFAVTFQAMMGALLFGLFSNLRLAALLLGVVGIVEAALQKVLVMTIIYGNSIWKSIDVFVNYVLQQLSFISVSSDFSASVWLVGGYLGLHTIAGVAVGWLAGLLPNEIVTALRAPRPQHFASEAQAQQIESNKARRHFGKSKTVKLLMTLMIIAAILTFLAPATGGIAQGWYVVLRAATVLLFWYFIAAPVLMRLLQKFLKRKKARYGREIENALLLFPRLKGYAAALWNAPAQTKGWRRWKNFIVALIVFALTFDQEEVEAETTLSLRSEISN